MVFLQIIYLPAYGQAARDRAILDSVAKNPMAKNMGI